MVKVRYDAFKEIVILDKVKYSLEDFIKVVAMPTGSGVASWADGIVFHHSLLPWSETTIKEAVDGRLYWSHVAYSELTNFKPLLESKDGRVRVAVLDVSSSEVMKQAARWLKVLERLPEYWEKAQRLKRVGAASKG